MKILTTTLITVSTALISAQAMAHPGDHSEGNIFTTLVHFLTQPDHMLFIGVTGALACFSVRMYKKIKTNKNSLS